MIMKRLLAASAVFVFASHVHANELSLDTASETPPGSLNATALSIDGDDNVLTIRQTAPASSDPSSAHGNRLTVAIDGDRNGGFDHAAFSPELVETTLDPGLFAQDGLGNAIDFTVTGSGNLFAFSQSGDANSATGMITGSNNQAVVQQSGNNNIAAFSQTGNGNIVSISQTAW